MRVVVDTLIYVVLRTGLDLRDGRTQFSPTEICGIPSTDGGDVQVVVDTLIYVVGVGALDNPFIQI